MTCASCGSRPPPDARFCPACGARTHRPDRAAAPERKLVTVVFCDMVGSTALSQTLDPETLRSVVLRYFAAVRAAIEDHGGTVEKFIGDAVMAVFGVPVMFEDDARRAATAALGALDAVAALNTDLEPGLGVRLRVRIGVHTGPAVAGTDVSDRQALVSGDTVNIAARLQQHAGEGEILLGPRTRDAIGPTARTEPVGPLLLKGIARPLVAYRLLGVGADDPAALRRFDLPFVGRGRELDALDRALGGASGSTLVTVYGEPGIGKTRLVRAWLDRTSVPHLHGAGRCRPYGESGSLAPLAEAVHDLLASPAARSGPDPGVRGVLATGLLPDGTPGPSLEATTAATATVLATLARQAPVIVTVDDCHWAGDTLLDVLDRLARLTRPDRTLIVCLARLDLRDRRPGWDGLVLDRLTRADCELVVAIRAEVTAHRAVDTTRLLDAAGGNPFFLEQLLAAGETPGETGPGELPHGLQALLGARIDALAAAERTALELAAVLGREFGATTVAALAAGGPEGAAGGPLAGAAGGPLAEAAVDRALAGLIRGHLIEAAGPDSLRFRNAVIHEVTYRAMAKRTRADRHARAADLPVGPAAAATHLERAYRYRAELGLRDDLTEGLRRRAVRGLTAAGVLALTRSDLTWAANLLGRAVDLAAPGEPGWAAATRNLGEVQIATGQVDAGAALLRTVVASGADEVEVAHARLALAVAGDGPVPADVARAVLPVFTAAGDDLGLARAHIRIAQQRQQFGRHAEADSSLRTGLSHAARRDAEPELALALGAAAVSLWRGPLPVPEAIGRCLGWLADHGPPRPTVRVTLGCPLAVLLALDDRPDEACESLATAQRHADELGYPESRVVLPIFRATVESLAGRPGVALDLLDRAARAATALAATGLLGTVRREAARLLIDSGRHAAAAERLTGDPGGLLRADRADLDGLRARLAAAGGPGTVGGSDVAGALDLSRRALAAAAATDSPIVRATALLDRAEVLARAGRLGDARAAATAAGRCHAAKRHRPGLRRVAAYHRWLDAGAAGTVHDEEAPHD